MTKHFLPFIALLLFLGCEKYDYDKIDFVELQIDQLTLTRFDQGVFTASFKNLKVEKLTEVGFLWSRSDPNPNLSNFEGIVRLGSRDTDGSFSAEVKGLRSNQLYYVVAFAQQRENTFFSAVAEFSTAVATASILSFDYNGTRDLTISGQLTGFDKGVIAIEHGFCWSYSNQRPNLDDEAAFLGNRTTAEPFSYTLKDILIPNPVYFCAFGIFRGNSGLDTILGPPVTFFERLWDVWDQGTDINRRYQPVAFSIGGKGYVGTGSSGGFSLSLPYVNAETDYLQDFFEYDPDAALWTRIEDFPGQPRRGGVSFVIDETAYVGGGRNSDGALFRDFYSFNPSRPAGSRWETIAPLPEGEERAEAASFVVNQTGYVIGGLTYPWADNDVWAYDPAKNKWEKKGSPAPGAPRIGASAMTLMDKGYFGLGWHPWNNEYLTDFWEYDPATDRWEQKSDFAGDGRKNAVSLSTSAQSTSGYLGTGFTGLRYVKDFWVYDTLSDSWEQKPDKPNEILSGAAAFAIGKDIYVLGGENYAFALGRALIYRTE